jgi:hypothetical protein
MRRVIKINASSETVNTAAITIISAESKATPAQNFFTRLVTRFTIFYSCCKWRAKVNFDAATLFLKGHAVFTLSVCIIAIALAPPALSC